jgi:hypothetical protein
MNAQNGIQKQTVERELRSTIMKLADALKVGYDEAYSIVKAVHIAVSKLQCPLLAAWALRHAVARRFGDAAAVAAAAGALIYACGRADYDSLMRCAWRGYSGVQTQTASAIVETVYEIGTAIGLPPEEALRIAGLLKYRYLNFAIAEPEIRGEGALWGELVAYALRLL